MIKKQCPTCGKDTWKNARSLAQHQRWCKPAHTDSTAKAFKIYPSDIETPPVPVHRRSHEIVTIQYEKGTMSGVVIDGWFHPFLED